ncbi:hypothetical protein N7E81_07170 [Reichenbachiella carrageenanivorans]|uniref:RHS repeat-associated core domain-containing protein n=1 Tax=Reichenbachiella carrageenanivorans TaxID=2979869 RepID=A0ABY6D3Z3_9BACT|nr:hypothetical protein [Reichenbachiella carrageenanivorans]UXX80879.1 hypothetical protein N7E81_07170 [Reichenbachiella carrageenanivorans]
MKRILGLVFLFSITTLSYSQNPFDDIGIPDSEVPVLTLSNGEFQEFHDQERFVQIGSVLFDTETMLIAQMNYVDTAYSEATLEPEVTSRWLTDDPMRQYASPYVGMGNDPVNQIDPDGALSTHTDKDGNVQAVFNDGDLGVYQHLNGFDVSNYSETNISAGGILRGETSFWNEFINPESGVISGRIEFGRSWDDLLSILHDRAHGDNVATVALASSPGGEYDIKHPKNGYTTDAFNGRLLNGKYASARSAGNYLAGWNGRYATTIGGKGGVSKWAFMNIAGGLHKGLPAWRAAKNVIFNGTEYGPAPYYGEVPYAGRMILLGWDQ